MTHMTRAFRCARRLAAAPILGTLAAVASAAALVACSSTPLAAAAPPVAVARGAARSRAQRRPPAPGRDDLAAATIERPRARWVAVALERAAGLGRRPRRRVLAGVPAQLRAAGAGLARRLRQGARSAAPAPPSDAATRDWLQRQLRPYRIESLERDPVGLATGYFEPLVEASRASRPGLSRRPVRARRPTWRRASPTGRASSSRRCRRRRRACSGREIAWVRDRARRARCCRCRARAASSSPPSAAARRRLVRVAYAGPQRPAVPIGRPLADRPGRAARRARPRGRRSAPGRGRHPARVDEMLRSNPRVVFFREEPLPDPGDRAEGRAGRAAHAGPLDRGRSAERSVRHARLARHHRAALDPAAAPPRGRAGHRLGDRRRGPRRLLLGLGRRRRGRRPAA